MHMTGRKDFLRDLKLTPNIGFVTYGNKTNSQIRGYDILTNNIFYVYIVTYMTDLKHSVISVAQLTDANQRVELCKKHNYAMTEDRKECLIKSD